ncbi:NTPase [Bacteroidia bacterium]|nr:NTPase [Bacteroidia bacterium]
MEEENKNITHPRFIPNKPCGIDKSEGKSQERLTNAIVNHIVSNDNNSQNLSRIIGLEGGWGVGKTNVIQQLIEHNKIKSNYYIFEYDAWGNQEDLQRRPFLETITKELIEEKILEDNNKIHWQQKLDDLLAHKITRVNKSMPQFNAGAFWTALFLALTPITTFISERLENAQTVNCLWMLVLIAFSPILLGIIVWGITAILDKDARHFGYLLKISKNEDISTTNTETINEEEPTVAKFKAWMSEISNYIEENKKPKLIIVYDNMDRLPSEKVKQLWSSIHTFFAENGFDNIWAIIPFDEKHLSCAFGESEQLTKHFISKTFPVVYRVTPPVITDFKNIFNTLFEEAFGNTEIKQQEDINRIFRLEKPNATVREMIEYINQLVALKNIWHNEIDILYIAVFALKKDDILSAHIVNETHYGDGRTNDFEREVLPDLIPPAEQILSGKYLSEYIKSIIPNDEILQKNISALVYGVSLAIAEQIPMSKHIDSCFNLEVNADINKFKDTTNFIHILSDKVKNSDIAQLDNVIQCLSQLDSATLSEANQQTIITLWNTLAQRKMKVSLTKQEFDDKYKLLLTNADNNHKQNIVKRLCKQIQSFKDFNSENYYNSLCEIDEFVQSNNIEIQLTDCLIDIEKEPELFVKYVLVAKENFPMYKLIVNTEELNEYISNATFETPVNDANTSIINANSALFPTTDFIEILRILQSYYKFEKFLDKIKTLIPNTTPVHFKPLFDVYKILSDEKPLKVQLNPTQRQIIWNALASKPNTPEYLEIVTIQIANGTNAGGTFNEEQIKYIAENLDYYASYGDLLLNSLSWNIPHLIQALKYMTENKLGISLSIENILPQFEQIKSRLGVTDAVLLIQLNRWEKDKNKITKDNIQQILPNAQFFQFSKATKNNLTDYLNTTIIEALAKITTDTLYQQRQQPTYYWNTIMQNFIDTDFIKPLPDNLTELGKLYLDDIAKGVNVDTVGITLIEKLDPKKTKETIANIKNQICNNVANYKISVNKFKLLHSWLEKQGDLQSRAGDVCQYILSPVANDDDCLKIIIENDLYISIINSSDTQADTFNNTIKTKISKSTDNDLIAFAKKIGIEKEIIQ